MDWWFVFKLNAAVFPMCGGGTDARACPFGGTKQDYPSFGQLYAYASSESGTLQDSAKSPMRSSNAIANDKTT
ncbi:MAG TPA: hypothetical protein VHZ52_05170 [Acidobacteriaceae bacterium]|nr:hypothetical protein [Acidobacteriaceae bacterium]